MNIAKAQKFVKDHKVAVALVAGVALGALAVYSHYNGKTLLELPKNALQNMEKTGGNIVYDVPGEGLFVLIPVKGE